VSWVGLPKDPILIAGLVGECISLTAVDTVPLAATAMLPAGGDRVSRDAPEGRCYRGCETGSFYRDAESSYLGASLSAPPKIQPKLGGYGGRSGGTSLTQGDCVGPRER
jgi:hypothetical protein